MFSPVLVNRKLSGSLLLSLVPCTGPGHLLQSPSVEGILFALQIRMPGPRRHSSSPRPVGPPGFPHLGYGCHRGFSYLRVPETDSKGCWETLCLLYRASVSSFLCDLSHSEHGIAPGIMEAGYVPHLPCLCAEWG